MPRKYDRYGINRQYRRNPSRKRNPFPYRLPFVPGYRTNPFDSPDAHMSNVAALRNWEKLTKGLLEGAQNRALDRQSRGYLYNRSSQDAYMSDVAPKRKYGSYKSDAAIIAGAGLKTASILMREKMRQFKNKAILDWGSKYAMGAAYGRPAMTVAQLLAF